MGVNLSTPNVRGDNQLFPPEVVEKIVENLSLRDQLIARQVCYDWRNYLDSTNICTNHFSKAIIKVEDSDEPLRFFTEAVLGMMWTSFSFKNVQFSRHSLSFWKTYGDTITHIEFYGCTFPRNHPNLDEAELRNQCKNLKHLGIRQCGQYLMMGKIYFHLHKFFSLDNLESLDFSENQYVSDHAVLSLCTKTKKLRSLNLSECNVAFTFAVFNRFYPGHLDNEISDFSDNVLTFHTIHKAFLSAPNAKYMRELKLNSTRVDMKALRLIMDPDYYTWESMSLNKCTELKSANLVEFINCQQKNLKKLEIESSKLLPRDIVNIDFSNIIHLVIKECGELTFVDFLQNMPHLQYFDMSTCAGVQLQTQDFSKCKNLRVFKMRSSVPFYMLNQGNSPVTPVLLDIFKGLPNLRELDVGSCGTAVTDEVVQIIIKYMPLLSVLKLCKSRITDRGLAGIEVDEFDCRLSPRVILSRRANILTRNNNLQPGESLSRLINLKELNLSYCLDLSEATWKSALSLPNLIKLDISGCSQISVKGFLSVITTCKNLETLNITQCGLHITGDPTIFEQVYSALPRLRHLIM